MHRERQLLVSRLLWDPPDYRLGFRGPANCFAIRVFRALGKSVNSRMDAPMKTFSAFLSLFCCSWAFGIEIDRTGFESGNSFAFAETETGFRLDWQTKRDTAHIEFQFIPRRGNNPAGPLVREIGLDGIPTICSGSASEIWKSDQGGLSSSTGYPHGPTRSKRDTCHRLQPAFILKEIGQLSRSMA